MANWFTNLFERKFTPADPTVDWERVQHLVLTANTVTESNGDMNSAVFACLVAIANATVEAPLMVVQHLPPETTPLLSSPLQQFLDEPNDELTMLEIRWWLAYARHLDGNAYLVKSRSGNATSGLPVELWPVSPHRMAPHSERGSRRLIDWYTYEGPDGQEKIPPQNVIHFKMGVDPRDPRLGLSPLKRLLREIASDAEATKFGHALLANYGIPGVVIKLPLEAQLSPRQLEELKSSTKREFATGNQGKVGILTGGADMEQFGFSPEQLNLKALHEFPETRIAAVMGVDPLVAKLGVGLDQSSNYASARQVRENFTELTIVPNWKIDEDRWTKRLARDFTPDRSIKIIHDLSQVRSLQEDETEKYRRINEAWRSGLIGRQEARIKLGYDPEMPPDAIVQVLAGVAYIRADEVESLPIPQQPPQLPAGKAVDLADLAQKVVDVAADGLEADLVKWQAQNRETHVNGR